jgi:hypothetical protein
MFLLHCVDKVNSPMKQGLKSPAGMLNLAYYRREYLWILFNQVSAIKLLIEDFMEYNARSMQLSPQLQFITDELQKKSL